MKSKYRYIYWFVLAICCVLIALNIYLYIVFKATSAEEIFYTLKAPKGHLPNSYLLPIIKYFICPIVIQTIVLYFLNKVLNKKVILLIITILTIGMTYTLVKRIKLDEYLIGYSENSEFIEKNYIDPNDIKIEFPSNKRNLIHIYLESTELSFLSKQEGGAFSKSVIKELGKLAEEGESFSGSTNFKNGANSLNGATWTMGGAFAAETGLPLKIKIDGNSMDTQEHFFKDVKALGDILKDNGYNTVVMKDVDMTFAGSELFYTEHGKNLVIDDKYVRTVGLVPEEHRVWAGFEDKLLFEIAKNKLLELSKKTSPFALTFYTNDTHAPDGYLCDICSDDFSDQYSNVYACSSKQVYDFIEWIKKQDFYPNTTIVIHGDHPTMNPDYVAKKSIIKNYNRRVYVNFLNSPVKSISNISRQYSTFDLFPTILASLGVKISGDKLGLGTNLYSNTKTLMETYGVDKVNNELNKKSLFMDKLSQIHILDQDYIEKINKENNFNQHNFDDFLTNLIYQKKDKIIFISIKDEGTAGLSQQSVNLLTKLGIKTDFKNKFRYSYAAIIDNKNIEEKISKSKVGFKKTFKDTTFNIQSAGLYSGNYSKIFVNSKNFSLQKRGMNFVVFDKNKSEVVGVRNFDTFLSDDDRNYLEIEETKKVTEQNGFKLSDLNNYIEKLIKYKDKYIICISVRDEASSGLDTSEFDILKQLGLKQEIQGKFRYSYAAIINGQSVIEKLSKDAIQIELSYKDNKFTVYSAGMDAGNKSAIRINSINYSLNKRGLNFVVFDKNTKKVIAINNFDTFMPKDQRTLK